MRAEFDETLVTGNDMIDSQHKELIGKINQLLESCEDGQGKVKAVKMLDYLLDYTEFHFSAEEKLQEEIEYPGLEKHREKHNEFRQAVKELQEMLEEEEGPTENFVKQVLWTGYMTISRDLTAPWLNTNLCAPIRRGCKKHRGREAPGCPAPFLLNL